MKVWEKVIGRRIREETRIKQNQYVYMFGRCETQAYKERPASPEQTG